MRAQGLGCRVVVAACVLWLGGCRNAVLSVDDALLRPSGKVRLAAYVEREAALGLRKDVERARVEFYADGRRLGEDRTDDEGQADVEGRPNPGAARYEARATVDGRELRTEGRIFEWIPERVIIAVDIDQTIERTKYRELILNGSGDPSDPVKRSAETLRTLAGDSHILYLTSRPRFLLDKTRAWLHEHEFPDGPVVTARGVRESMRPGAFKGRMLRDLRDDWPGLLIGIGDRPSDASAYGANHMLALALANKQGKDYGPHAIVFGDWKALGSFFAANRATLTSVRGVKDAVAGKPVLFRPVLPYRTR